MKGYVIMAIIWIVAAVPAGIVAFLIQNNVTETRGDIEKLEREIAATRTIIGDERKGLKEISSMVGLISDATGYTSREATVYFVDSHRSILGEKEFEDYINSVDKKKSMENLVTFLRKKTEEYKAQADSAWTEYLNECEIYNEEIKGFGRGIKEIIDEVKSTRTDLDTQIRQIITEIENLRRTEASLDSELARLDDEARIIREKFETDRNEHQEKIRELEARLDEIKHRTSDASREDIADGKVVLANHVAGVIYINLNRSHYLRPGTEFEVFTMTKGREKVPKGAIQVFEVGDDMSQARIIEEGDILNPITSGDLISNKLYDPNRKLHFAFAGNVVGKYAKDQLIAMIREFGGIVDGVVASGTDYLVLGEGYAGSDNARKAEELGVELLRYDQLLEILGK